MTEQKIDNYHTILKRLRHALDDVPAFVYIKDNGLRYLYANQLTLERLGCGASAILKCSDSDFFPPKTAHQLRKMDTRVLQGESTQGEVFIELFDGSQTVYWNVKTPIYQDSKSSDVIGILGISIDITHQKQREETLFRDATTDSLTGLSNRRLLCDRLSVAMKKSQRFHHYMAVIFIDLDRFKQVNDIYGHSAGDQCLIDVANRIMDNIREYDSVARISGDEFVVLVEDLGLDKELAQKQAQHLVNKIRTSFNAYFRVKGVFHRMSASIGVTVFSGTAQSPTDILAESDRLMYENKQNRR